MHFTEQWAIRERDHTIQNPTSPEKLMLLADYCRVHDGMRLLDKAAGQIMLRREGAWTAASVLTPPIGGTTVDAQARTAIVGLIAALADAGILPGS